MTDRSAMNGETAAFTLIELMIVIALVGLLAGMGGSSYLRYVEKARVVRAIAEIDGIATILDGLAVDEEFELPTSLAAIGQGDRLDPWGHPYRYLKIQGGLPPNMSQGPLSLPDVAAPPENGGGPSVISQARKDRFLVPINSDYDLYSVGPDGRSKPPLQNPDSCDDVIRANDGAYIGPAENY